ncbi:cysteine synthase family protein [Actinocrinis sp.]|uniref:cysteine synthase family protein n=1 Tax=Actinocrinis sp. TaxID=1920516 RepID=UPI002D27FB07|nr:cysteine synthase family protein [Actinocrinis sp.]HZP53957.1 cysteine synthase family protein [Actinocrinis sp.]
MSSAFEHAAGRAAGADPLPHTELRELKQLAEPDAARIFVKCEFLNPTGSHKDRVFSYMIDQLEAEGTIRPGQTLVECSTGNGGAALSRVCRDRGYQAVIIMPEGMTEERRKQIASFGGTIIETSQDGFLLESEDTARRYVQEHPGSHFLDQSTNDLNWKSWRSCGQEIVAELRARDVVPDHFICSIGTGGTFTGIADILKQQYPDIVTTAVEVDRSAALYAKRHGLPFEHHTHNMMGLGPGKVPSNLREELVDRVELISGDDGWTTMKRLIAEEGLFVGPTAGGNVFAAQRLARTLPPQTVVVTVLFDSAWKYFSVWEGQYPKYSTGDSATTR